MTHLSKPVVLLALVSACAPVGYIKPGMTEEEVTRDRSECAEIARHEAFRDFRFDPLPPWPRHRDRFFHRYHGRSLSELKYRYRRICMLARGYQFAPLDDPVVE